MTLREVLNLWAYCLLLMAVFLCVDLLFDLVKGRPVDIYDGLYLGLSLSPSLLALITGQAYGVDFFVS